MPARPRTTTQLIDVGGVEVTPDQITAAIDILTSASGVMVKQPLARAEHPLAACDYHRVAAEQRVLEDGEKSQTKPALIRALGRLAAGE